MDPAWAEHLDPASGKRYYHNASTQETVWERPASMAPAPAPEDDGVDWVKHSLPCGKEYYEHKGTEETSWTVPAGYHESLCRRDWRECEDPESGDVYYYNLRTQETSWEPPEGYEASRSVAAAAAAAAPVFREVVPRANPVALFDTSLGTFEAEIYLDRVPVMASNFIDLVKSGFYDGVHVHRITPGRMVWMGCPFSRDLGHDSIGKGLPPVGPFQNLWTGETEHRVDPGFVAEERTDRTDNDAGCLAMINAGRTATTGSIFVISVVENHEVNHFTKGPMKFPVFGRLKGARSLDFCKALSEVGWVRSHAGHHRPDPPVRLKLVTMRDGATEAGVFASALDVKRALEAAADDDEPAAKKRRAALPVALP